MSAALPGFADGNQVRFPVPHEEATQRRTFELQGLQRIAVAMAAVNRCGTGSAPSLYDAAILEADRHKWLVSERLGRDGGFQAWSEWWVKYWPGFCRHRRLEHLRGDRRWREFEDDFFGHFYDRIVQGDPLLNEILDRVAEGWENLNFTCWLHEQELSSDDVLQILEVVNINTAARLEPHGA